jgi:hypothetical protein
MTFQYSRPQGGAVGSDGWVDEVHPLECRRGFHEVVVLTEGSARRGEGEGARGVGASGHRGVGASGRRGIGARGVGDRGVGESGRRG